MKYFIFLIIFLCSVRIGAQPLLITEEEMNHSLSNPIQLIPKSAQVPDAPVIELITPKLQSAISSPTPIQLKFISIAPAIISIDSFKVFYGTFQIDITERILKVAQITPNGIDVKEASLPKGKHRLTLNIQDSFKRLGSRNIEFEIK